MFTLDSCDVVVQKEWHALKYATDILFGQQNE